MSLISNTDTSFSLSTQPMAALFSPTVSPTRFSPKTYIYIHTPNAIIPFPVHTAVLVLFYFPSCLHSFSITIFFYRQLINYDFFVLKLISKASASPVLKEMVTSKSNIKICGVPTNAVIAFVHFIYTSRSVIVKLNNYSFLYRKENWINKYFGLNTSNFCHI